MLPQNRKNYRENVEDGNNISDFGPFSLDAGQRTLRINDQKIALKPKTFEVLEVLLKRVNQVVLKNELIEEVWRDAYVDEANLAVHISALRKLLAASGDQSVTIETIPKVGYRLVAQVVEGSDAEGRVEDHETEAAETHQASREGEKTILATAEPRSAKPGFSLTKWLVLFVSLAGAALVVLFFILSWRGQGGIAMGEGSNATNRKSAFTWVRQECPRDSARTNLEEGGCDDAVKSFSLNSNPNGNWAYGYSPKDDVSQFILFEKAKRNDHFASSEIPVDWWSRPDEWHPLILKNTSNLVFLIQGAVVVPPTMFEMHPGPKGERSVVRWIAPADGFYRIQGQFRGINGSGYTTTDVLVVENGDTVRFTADIAGYNFEEPFDLEVKSGAGQTVDFSVGYGKNGKYEGDSTGFSVIVTTLFLEGDVKNTAQ